MIGLIEVLESSAFAVHLRRSVYLYPVLNTAHILGLSLLVGASLPRNLLTAIAGVRASLGPLNRVLGYSEGIGLALALISGLLLFIVGASAYLSSAVFLAKMVLLFLALTTGFISSRLDRARSLLIRLFSATTALLWVAVLTAGRFIAYF